VSDTAARFGPEEMRRAGATIEGPPAT